MLLVFDLDDTLYDEATFVDSGFRAVATMLSPRLHLPADELADRMHALMTQHGRGRVFDYLLADYDVVSPGLVTECVAAYRAHDPQITLRPDVESMGAELASDGHRLYVVTDGDADVQRTKATTLGLDRFVVAVYPTWEYGPEAAKPSLTCFECILDREGATWSDLTYVADDPSKDFVSLNRVGASTVRVHAGRFADVVAADGYDAQQHVDDVVAVPALLGLPSTSGD